MATATSKSVTKTGLSAFLRQNSALNLTQSKDLAARLLGTHNISAKPPADPGAVTVEAGQTWIHTDTGRIMTVTHVDLGPQYVADDPVTAWGPERVHWEDATNIGVVEITPWLERMQLQEQAPESPSTSSSPSSESRNP